VAAGLGSGRLPLRLFPPEGRVKGVVALGILLVIAWVVGFLVFKIAGLLIHLLLIVGVIMLLLSFLRKATGSERSSGA
jgi:hypothetical protein